MITVGIVEDNRELRESLARMVEEAQGFRCVCACATAEEGLLEIPRTLPDVVLMDIHLPVRTGIECTRRLKDLCPSVQILILTVYEDNENILNALKAGASGYLLKRASRAKILASIIEVKEGGSPMTSHIARKVVASFREPARQPTPEEQGLSERESEVLGFLTKGHNTREIAEKMHVSVNTVRVHIQHIYTKLHVRSRTEMLLRFRP